jgi:hypothetical protein
MERASGLSTKKQAYDLTSIINEVRAQVDTWRNLPASQWQVTPETARLLQAAGLNGAAQIVHDLGARADPRKLARAAAVYENSTARRLGYLLEHFGHARQAASLRPLAGKA